MEGHTHTDHFIDDYCDGSAYKSHTFFSVDPTALQVILYYVAVCNPIGSRAKKHKIGMLTFFSLTFIFVLYSNILLLLRKYTTTIPFIIESNTTCHYSTPL